MNKVTVFNIDSDFSPFVCKAINRNILQAMYNMLDFIKTNVDKDQQAFNDDKLSENQQANFMRNVEDWATLNTTYSTLCKEYKDMHLETFVPYVRGHGQQPSQPKVNKQDVAAILAKMNKSEHQDELNESGGVPNTQDYGPETVTNRPGGHALAK